MSPGSIGHSPYPKPLLKPPSSAILAALAAIAAAAIPANANPAPPAFLCPSLHAAPTPPPIPTRLASRSATHHRPKQRHLPDKYESQNGVWRRVDVWTLYGSTVCVNCGDSHQDETTAFESNQTKSVLPTNTPTYDIRDTLPPGWKPTNPPGATRITIILGLSLALSVVICILIIACVHRRKSKRHKRLRDVEKRGQKRPRTELSSDDSTNRDLIIQKELKMKQRLWARATARWKDNIRYSARQRRGRRSPLIYNVAIQTSSVSLDQQLQHDEQQNLRTVPPSPVISQHSTIESLYADRPPPVPPDPTIPTQSVPNTNALSRTSSFSSQSVSPVSPPAYDRHTSLSRIRKEDEGDDNQLSSLFSHSSVSLPGNPFSDIPNSVHVATDDKTLLARLADLASSPPAEVSDPSQMASTSLEVSAPVWDDDDDLEEYREQLYNSDNLRALNCSALSSTPVFPPPPFKGKSPASYYAYRYSLEDIMMESDIGTSAPPFEQQPSCPPLDDLEITASAPPLPELYDLEIYSIAPGPEPAADPPPTTEEHRPDELSHPQWRLPNAEPRTPPTPGR